MILNFCPSCGSKALPEGKFCVSCGQALSQPTQPPSKVEAAREDPSVTDRGRENLSPSLPEVKQDYLYCGQALSREFQGPLRVEKQYQARMSKGGVKRLASEFHLPVLQYVPELVKDVQAQVSQVQAAAFNLKLWAKRAGQILALVLLVLGGAQCLPDMVGRSGDTGRVHQSSEPAHPVPPVSPPRQQTSPVGIPSPKDPGSNGKQVAVPTPSEDRSPLREPDSSLERAHARYLEAYNNYTGIISGKRSGDAKAAQSEYREAYRQYIELRHRSR